MKFTASDVQPSNEGFFSGLSYLFKSDSKIADSIASLKTKLSTVDEDRIRNLKIKITTYSCKHLQDCIKLMDVVFQETQDVVKYADDYNKALNASSSEEDPNADALDIVEGNTPEAKRAFDGLVKAMRQASKTISQKVNPSKMDWTKIDGSKNTLGEMGYTKSAIQQIVNKFSDDIRKNKALYELLTDINEDLDMGAFSHGDKELELYHICISNAHSAFKAVDYFLFSLYKRI